MFYKAIPIEEKPYILWQELTADEPDNPLVIDAADLPPYEYGVSTKEIKEGALVDRDMTLLEREYNAVLYTQKGAALQVATFEYDGTTFPMHEVARLYYKCIENTPGGYNLMRTDGQPYALAEANNEAFLTAYYAELLNQTQP